MPNDKGDRRGSDNINTGTGPSKPLVEADIYAQVTKNLLKQAASLEERAAVLRRDAEPLRTAASKVGGLAGFVTSTGLLAMIGTPGVQVETPPPAEADGALPPAPAVAVVSGPRPPAGSPAT